MILPKKQMHFPDHANLYFIHLFKHFICFNTLFTKHQIVSNNILNFKTTFDVQNLI